MPRNAVVVTATPEALAGLGDADTDPLVLSVVPCAPGPRRRYVPMLSAEAVRAALAEHAPEATHVRIVTDLEASLPADLAWSTDWSAVRDLHDLSFLTLQATHDNLTAGTVLGLFLGGAGAPGEAELHPYAGLFSGLLKSVALELPGCRVASVFTTTRDLPQGLAELAAETRVRSGLPLAAWQRGRRSVVVVTDEPAVPAATPNLAENDVVLAIGGGHGITAELLREVVSTAKPIVYVAGSTPLADLQPRVEAAGGVDALDDRSGYLRRRRAEDSTLSVAAVNKEFERLQGAAQILRNLADLERRVGAGKVHYRRADVTNPADVRAVVDEIHRRHARVDLVIHAAGVNRSGALATKPLENYRLVRTIKVDGYRNLRAAFAGRPPRMWCSFGSFIGLTGQIGESDYASANDFLVTAAAAHRQHGQDEFTIGWTLWDEVGMGAHPVTRQFLAKSGVFTRMSTAEGLAIFAEELAAANRAAGMFCLGDAECNAIEAKLPGQLLGDSLPAASVTAVEKPPILPIEAPSSEPPFYLDRIVARDDTHLVAERLFNEDRDGYLGQHTVAGVGTLPGLFVPEIAAEAALELRPGMKVVGFRDVSFERFLKLSPSLTRTPRRVRAKVTGSSDAATIVSVEITGDVTAPNGKVVQKQVRHFAATVVLATEYPDAPRWPGLDLPGAGRSVETPVLDPYHVPGATVSLTGPFVTTRNTRMHPMGKRASYVSPVHPADPVFRRFVVPSLLLDGLARVAVLDLVAGRYVPVAAPRSVRRIDLYESGGDTVLGARYAELDLAVTPAGLNLEDAGRSNHFVAARLSGEIVAEMHDVVGIVLGYIDAQTGAPVDRETVERAATQSSWLPPVAAL